MITRFLLVASILALPTAAVGQVATVEPDTVVEPPVDAGDVLGTARDAQARFERTRLRYARLTLSSGGGPCDENVGRFCTTYHEGEWYPRAESAEVVEARVALLSELDSLQRLAPRDDWIAGQRVWYRADGGNWDGALQVAVACGVEPSWWCEALQGLALHGLGRYSEALQAFENALATMDGETARDWRVPERALDRRARGRVLDAERAAPDSLTAVLATVWTLADPLYLVAGNDRLTEHYARWTVSTLKVDARNPYGLRWGSDLEELTVRHGWELGWERVRSPSPGSRDGAIGHKHPDGRDYLPSGRALEEPAAAPPSELAVDRREPRSLYAPPYAPVFLPIEADVAVFRRGDRAVLVATPYLPDDTTFHATHDHPRPWLEPGDQAGMAQQIGLFAMPIAGGELSARAVTGGSEGTLTLDVPVGDYVVSVESWSPEHRRAGRSRTGIRITRAPEDVATVSDILLLRGTQPPPESLEEALPLVLVRPRIQSGDSLAIAWEVTGLGFRAETLDYAVSVHRTDRNVLRRIGEFLRLADRPQPLALSWQEPAPDTPAHQFRHLALDLPPLDPGHYEITLTLTTPARSDTIVTRAFEVIAPTD